MLIESFLIEDEKRQVQGQHLTAENPCACGCSPNPFVLISNGKFGLNARFEFEDELKEFKEQVNQLQLPIIQKSNK